MLNKALWIYLNNALISERAFKECYYWSYYESCLGDKLLETVYVYFFFIMFEWYLNWCVLARRLVSLQLSAVRFWFDSIWFDWIRFDSIRFDSFRFISFCSGDLIWCDLFMGNDFWNLILLRFIFIEFVLALRSEPFNN